MKKNLLLVVACVLSISIYAQKKQETVTFNVPLDCEGCIEKVEKNITFEKGVRAIDCNLEEKTVKVTYQPKRTNVESLKKGFAKIGYSKITVKEEVCHKEKKMKSSCCQGSKPSAHHHAH